MGTIVKFCLLFLTIITVPSQAQKNIEQVFDLGGKKSLELNFKWPKIIKVSNWEGETLKITGTVLINNGEDNDAFNFTKKLFDNQLVVSSGINDVDNLPRKIMIKRDGMTYYFNTQNWDDPEVQKFMNEEGAGANEYVTMGVIKEIQLEVYVPKNIDLTINAKYGMVEVDQVTNTLNVDAKYGGIDMAFGNSAQSLRAKTRYGEIYSDLPFDLESNIKDFHREDKWIIVSYKGGAKNTLLESKYGDVFLRQKRGG